MTALLKSFVVACVPVMLFASCSKTAGTASTPSPTPSPKTVTFTAKDAGKTVMLRVGDKIVIELSETPGTGYSWEFAENPSGVLRKVSERLMSAPQPSGPPIVGRPEKHRFTFEAMGAGRTSIELRLIPPGGGKADGTYSVGVEVA